jgi:hypothetical protein
LRRHLVFRRLRALFEGTPAQMLASLDALAALPGNTRVCCAHEYTLSNLRFARAVEPANAAAGRLRSALQGAARRRAAHPALHPGAGAPINPFLRTREASVVSAAQAFDATRAPAEKPACLPPSANGRTNSNEAHHHRRAGQPDLAGRLRHHRHGHQPANPTLLHSHAGARGGRPAAPAPMWR